jgi:hypothetical protein
MLSNNEILFGSKPKACATPMIENDIPEIDTSDFHYELSIKQYQYLIGALQ